MGTKVMITPDMLTKEYIQNLVGEDSPRGRRAAVRALMQIYERQTDHEKSFRGNVEHNGVGFGGVDVEFFTSLAENYKNKGWLSDRQIYQLQKRNSKGVPKIGKYWKQLREIGLEKMRQQEKQTKLL